MNFVKEEKIKRMVYLFAGIVATVCCFFILPMNAKATKVGDFEYTLDETTKTAIVGACDSNHIMIDIIIPNKVLYEGEYYFVTGIGSNAFLNCTQIETITLPEGLENIGYAAFDGCSGLKSIEIPSSVKSIKMQAFGDCIQLKTVILNEGLETIEDSAFWGCTSLNNIVVPQSVKTIKSYAFRGCEGLTSITLQTGLESIGRNAFEECTSLKSISIPSTVKKVEFATFLFCDSLETVNLSSGALTEIEIGAFNKCCSLKEINIPYGVKIIGEDVFYDCGNMKNVTMPETLESIGRGAFASCTGLKSVTIPHSVTSIGKDVFEDCAADLKVKMDCGLDWKNAGLKENQVELEHGYFVYQADDNSHWQKCHTCGAALTEKEKHNYDFDTCTVCGWSVTDNVELFVRRIYSDCLKRKPDEDGVKYWTAELKNGSKDGATVGAGFVFGDEYVEKAETKKEFIGMLYKVFMGREADDGGMKYWLDAMKKGMTREEVFKFFVESPEYTEICDNYGIKRGNYTIQGIKDPERVNGTVTPEIKSFVERIYVKALGRASDPQGIAYWSKEIADEAKDPVLVAEQFILSEEFEELHLSDEEYIKVLYRTFMGREYDGDGLKYWLGRLQGGDTRQKILEDFASCPEFQDIISSFGI